MPTLVVLVVASLAPPLEAMPVRVRARTSLQVEAGTSAKGMRLTGRLLGDDGSGVGLATVNVEVSGLVPQEVKTEADGTLAVVISAQDIRSLAVSQGKSLGWRLEFHGDAHHGASSATGSLETARQPSTLRMVLEPRRASLATEAVDIRLRIAGGQRSVGSVPVRVSVGREAELVGQTDQAGQAVFRVHPDRFGVAGSYIIHARWDGDHRFAAASAKDTLRIVQPTRITLHVGREGSLDEGRYRFSGRLVDARGPVAGATVAITTALARGSPEEAEETAASSAAVTVTDEDGIFLTAIDTRDLLGPPAGVIEATAVYRPTDAWRLGAESRPVRIPLPGPPGVPTRWYVAAIAAILGLTLLIQALRMHFWAGLLAAIRAARHRARAGQPALTEEGTPHFVAAQGLALRPDWIVGRIVDAQSLTAVSEARWRLVRREATSSVVVGEPAAELSAGPLDPGPWTLDIGAPGYLTRRLEVHVPHDGSLDGATFGLLSARGHVRAVFATAAARLGVPFRWGYDTPREAATRIRTVDVGMQRGFAALRAHVERVWFGTGRVDAADASQADALLDRMGDGS